MVVIQRNWQHAKMRIPAPCSEPLPSLCGPHHGNAHEHHGGEWNSLKTKIPCQGFRDDVVLQEYLGEQMWRQGNQGHLFEAALNVLKNYMDHGDN